MYNKYLKYKGKYLKLKNLCDYEEVPNTIGVYYLEGIERDLDDELYNELIFKEITIDNSIYNQCFWMAIRDYLRIKLNIIISVKELRVIASINGVNLNSETDLIDTSDNIEAIMNVANHFKLNIQIHSGDESKLGCEPVVIIGEENENLVKLLHNEKKKHFTLITKILHHIYGYDINHKNLNIISNQNGDKIPFESSEHKYNDIPSEILDILNIYDEQIKELNDIIQQNNNELTNIVSSFENNQISQDEFKFFSDELNNKNKELINQIKELKKNKRKLLKKNK